MVVAPAPARAVRVLVLLAAATLAFAWPSPANANHVQTTDTGIGFTAQFDHDGDNEWWVEVEVKPGSYGVMDSVFARVEGTPTLQPMKQVPNDATRQSQGWLKFAPQQAFNVPAGTRVIFVAGFHDSPGNQDVVQSCWFTHPAGAEQCTSSTSSVTATGPPGTGSTTTSSSSSDSPSESSSGTFSSAPFDATFTGVRGNEWWVQAQVATNGAALVKVDVRLATNGAWGAWQPVAKQSWGWGSSYHIVQGTIVQLRATASTGQTDLSSCRQWIPAANTDAALVACPGGPGGTGWNSKVLQTQPDSWPTDLSVGDADRDGKTELYVPGDDALYRITAAGPSIVSTRPGWIGVAVGDGGQGRTDVYATRWRDDYSGSELRRLSWDGVRWNDQVVYSDAGHYFSALTLGDVGAYGGRDVYVARSDGGSAQVLESHWTGSQWLTQVVADLGDDGSFLDVWALWVANLDGDSNLELAALTGGQGYSNAWLIDNQPPAANVPSQWGWVRLPTHASYPAGLTAGDTDGDGRAELIVGTEGGLVLFRPTHENPYYPTFTRKDVQLGINPDELFFGDGDNDGKGEVYLTDYPNKVQAVRYAGGSYQVSLVGTLPGDEHNVVSDRIIVGDADGDGRRDVIVAMFDFGVEDGRIVQFTHASAPPPAFDATFSGVSGNNWWVQANVAGNQAIAKVEARVNCGAYQPLTKQGWGGWAASFHIPTGSKVTFRATSGTGATDASGGYVWPNATPTTGC